MMKKCPFCFEEAVIKESEESCSRLVCMECGAILSEQTITSNAAVTMGTTVVPMSCAVLPENITNNMRLNPTTPEGLSQGRRRIREIAASLSFTPDKVTAALSLYQDLFYREEVKYRSLEFKQNVALCVVYIISRQFGYPITIRELVVAFHSFVEDFSKAYSLVRKITNINLPAISLSSLTLRFLSKAEFSCLTIQRTQKILEIFDDYWLGGGGLHQHLITSAAYLAWSANHLNERKQTSLRQFCKKFKLQFSSVCKKKVEGMRSLLGELALSIPWVDTQLLGSDIALLYLDDILKYRRTLRCLKQQDVNTEDSVTEKDSESADASLAVQTKTCVDVLATSNIRETQNPESFNTQTDSSTIKKRQCDDESFSDKNTLQCKRMRIP